MNKKFIFILFGVFFISSFVFAMGEAPPDDEVVNHQDELDLDFELSSSGDIDCSYNKKYELAQCNGFGEEGELTSENYHFENVNPDKPSIVKFDKEGNLLSANFVTNDDGAELIIEGEKIEVPPNTRVSIDNTKNEIDMTFSGESEIDSFPDILSGDGETSYIYKIKAEGENTNFKLPSGNYFQEGKLFLKNGVYSIPKGSKTVIDNFRIDAESSEVIFGGLESFEGNQVIIEGGGFFAKGEGFSVVQSISEENLFNKKKSITYTPKGGFVRVNKEGDIEGNGNLDILIGNQRFRSINGKVKRRVGRLPDLGESQFNINFKDGENGESISQIVLDKNHEYSISKLVDRKTEEVKGEDWKAKAYNLMEKHYNKYRGGLDSYDFERVSLPEPVRISKSELGDIYSDYHKRVGGDDAEYEGQIIGRKWARTIGYSEVSNYPNKWWWESLENSDKRISSGDNYKDSAAIVYDELFSSVKSRNPGMDDDAIKIFISRELGRNYINPKNNRGFLREYIRRFETKGEISDNSLLTADKMYHVIDGAGTSAVSGVMTSVAGGVAWEFAEIFREGEGISLGDLKADVFGAFY